MNCPICRTLAKQSQICSCRTEEVCHICTNEVIIKIKFPCNCRIQMCEYCTMQWFLKTYPEAKAFLDEFITEDIPLKLTENDSALPSEDV